MSRSASRRELAKTIVDRCCSIRSTTRSSTCGQIEVCRALAAADPEDTSSSTTPSSVMSSTGTTTFRSHFFSDGGATTSTGCGATEEPGHLLDRAHRRRQADPLGGPLQQLVEPLEGDREVGAALGAGHGVHLVDDHGLDPAQRLARLRGEHQEQRLGRRDQDVGRAGRQLAALGRGGVAGPDAHRDVGDRGAEPVGGVPDAGQRRAQVALDVDRERLERRDVEDPAALQLVGRAARSRSAGRSTTGTR